MSYSALLGSMVYILPNFYFVRCAFRKAESQTPQSMMNWFYLGEVLKIFMTIGLFAMCFAWVRPLYVPAVFAAYIVMMVVNLAGMALVKGNIEETQNK
jgi:ATP synthase protein I